MIDPGMAAQYSRQGRPRRAEPCRRLMAAVLRTVVDDCRAGSVYRRSAGHPPMNVRLVRTAFAYVANPDRAWPFSFENICEALDMDATALREELRVTVALP